MTVTVHHMALVSVCGVSAGCNVRVRQTLTATVNSQPLDITHIHLVLTVKDLESRPDY